MAITIVHTITLTNKALARYYGIILATFELLREERKTNTGICEAISVLHSQHRFSDSECVAIRVNFNGNQPCESKNKEWRNFAAKPGGFWFPLDESGYRLRVSFLKHLIKIYTEADEPL